jgi:hypothetical protein
MPRHMSNSERIQRRAAEAAATAREKEESRKTAPARRASTPRAPKAPTRMKIVWAVGEPGSPAVKVFAYPEKAAADAEAARLGRGHIVKAVKVPME